MVPAAIGVDTGFLTRRLVLYMAGHFLAENQHFEF